MPDAVRISCVLSCGARPNFMKVASLADAFAATDRIAPFLVHTGQHYDDNMSAAFFDDLGLPRPDVNLGCGPGSHAQQTAEIMRRFEPVLVERRPDWLVVVGDVNSTLACALAAAKLNVRIAHVEAGLRSFDRSMPEEVNRVLTDRLSDLLFVTEPAGMTNLQREGVPPEKCHLVGDTLADTLLKFLPRAQQSAVRARLGLDKGRYALLTLHRAGNVDEPGVLGEIMGGATAASQRLPVVFPVHPRTASRLKEFGLLEGLAGAANLRLVEPLGYVDFLKLMADAAVVMTDSGGIQEETTILSVACMTLRDVTERPYTVEIGTNRLVKPLAGAIRAAFEDILGNPPRPRKRNELTDGRAGQRIARILLQSR